MAAIRSKWIFGISGTTKYAVKDLTEIKVRTCPVRQVVQVIAKKRIGYDSVLLKEYDAKIPGAEREARKFMNETFPSR